MRFALFFLAEYAGMVTTSAVCVALFFGGWHVPGLDRAVVSSVNHLFHAGAWIDPTNPAITNSVWVCCFRALAVFIKTLIVIFVFMWVRWSLPRFRFDQLMMLAWRALIPISLGLLAATAVIMYFWTPMATSEGAPLRIDGSTALVLLGGNVLVLLLAMWISMLIPPPPETNRKIRIAGSRYNRTPLPAGV
jgi:NADH-quinone oxidoreductase subunit H